MGLDMYLTKMPKIEGLSFELINQLNNQVCNTYSTLEEALSSKNPAVAILEPYLKEKGESFKYISIQSDVGYWRKANQIHNWFVDAVQDGVDDCRKYTVSKEIIAYLLEIVESLLAIYEDEGLSEEFVDTARATIPTTSGFFFGSTEYDKYYVEDLEITKSILEFALESVDFDNEYLVYCSSW